MPRIYKPIGPPENKVSFPVQETKTAKPLKDSEKKKPTTNNE